VTVFNAALVLYSALLVQGEVNKHDRHFSIDRLAEHRPLLLRAIECLIKLDKGNSVTQKCAEYLSTLVKILESLRERKPSKHASTAVRMLTILFQTQVLVIVTTSTGISVQKQQVYSLPMMTSCWI
jgi:hypothetical protein